MNKPTVVGTIKGFGHVNFNRGEMCTLLNMHFLGEKNCNFVDPKTKMLKPIEHPNRKALEKAHDRICPNHQIEVYADVMSDGTIMNFRTTP